MLAENASRLVALTRDVPVERLDEELESGWSVRDALGLICGRSEVWGRWIAQILTEDHPNFSFDLRPQFTTIERGTWFNPSDYPEWGLDDAVRAFSTRRRELLETLNGLTAGQWERGATVELSGGPSNLRTVRWFASELAKREQARLDQIDQILNPDARG
jgi:hypothetical protein